MKNELTAQQVVAFLTQHPDFLLNYPELLEKLNLCAKQQKTLSLVELQLAHQREQIHLLQAELDKFTQLAIQNSDIFLGLLPLQQQLSQASNLAQGIEKLNHWIKKFDVKQGKILLFNDSWEKSESVGAELWLDRNAFEIIRLERFGLRHFYLGEMSHKEKTMLFLPEEFPIGSVACCLLGGQCSSQTLSKPTALLVFSAQDSRHFHNGQDRAFLKHLVDIVSLHLERWTVHLKK